MPEDVDGLPDGPSCPLCYAELVREPLATEAAITLAFVCPEHGIAYVKDPFGE